MISLYVRVETVINNWAVSELEGRPATWEVTQRMDPTNLAKPGKRNAFANINMQGAARVRFGLEEKLSGPSGTFSSVSVRVEVEIRCDQDEEAIRHARDVVAKEGMKALEWYMGPALQMLLKHTEQGLR